MMLSGCGVTWRPPGSVGFKNCVENGGELAHGGDQRHFYRLAGRAQAQVVGPQHRVASNRRERRDVQHAPHARATAPDATAPAQGAAVVVVRSTSEQGTASPRLRSPNSGIIAKSTAHDTGPTPGTLLKSSPLARHSSELRTAWSRSRFIRLRRLSR